MLKIKPIISTNYKFLIKLFRIKFWIKLFRIKISIKFIRILSVSLDEISNMKISNIKISQSIVFYARRGEDSFMFPGACSEDLVQVG